jgi:hypothetical protein
MPEQNYYDQTVKSASLKRLAELIGGADNTWSQVARAELSRRQAEWQKAASDATVETGRYTRRMVFWMLISVLVQLVVAVVNVVVAVWTARAKE